MEKSIYEARRAALIAEITAAFNGVAREDGITLHQAAVIGDRGGPEEFAKAKHEDTERQWQDVPSDDIACAEALFNFLDPKGFRYYLPAVAVWYLETMEELFVFHGLVSQLKGWEIERSAEWYLEKFRILNFAQSQAIARFLLFLAERQEELEEQKLVSQLAGYSEAEKQEVIKNHKAAYGESKNDPRRGLNLYWGQFL